MRRLPFALVIIFVFLFSFLFLTPKTNNTWAAPTTLTATADAMIISNNPNLRYGSDPHLDLSKTSTRKIRDLIRFDLSSIPSNATITSATFSIYLYGCGSLSQTVDDLNIARITSDWEEYEVTWNTHKSKFDMSSTLSKTAPCSLNNQYHDFDIASFVENWRNGTWPNYGVGLYGKENSGASWIKYFYGREHPANKPPKLVLTYTLPVPPTNESTGDETDNDSDTTSSNQSTGSDKTSESPSDKKTTTIGTSEATGSADATISAKKSTPSATSKKQSRLTAGVAIALLSILLVALVIIEIYLVMRRKGKLQKKKEDDKKSSEETDKEEEQEEIGEETATKT